MQISKEQIAVQKALASLKEKGLKQSYLASVTNVTEGTISDLIHGKKVFSTQLIARVSEKLDKYTQKENETLIKEVSQYKVILNTATQCLNSKKALFALMTGGSGLGKTEVLKEFSRTYVNQCYMIRIEKGISYRELLEKVCIEIGELEARGKGKGREYKRLHSSKLLEKIKHFVENSQKRPMLIIDEAEEIPNGTLRNLKNLYTATEGLLSILISGINKTKDRVYKLAGMRPDGSLKDDNVQNEYTTFARRLSMVKVPQIGLKDLTIYGQTKGITNEKAINMIYGTGLFWNYQTANDMVEAIGANTLNKITLESFIELYNQYK